MESLISNLTIRQLCADDLNWIFSDRSRPHGQEWLERQAASEVYVAVAELDGRPVGRIGLDFRKCADEGMGYLWSAHVEEGFQSRGIGTALINHLETIARTQGFNMIRLDVDKTNHRARRFYERLGYAIYGEFEGRWSYQEGDRVIEVVEEGWTMRKQL